MSHVFRVNIINNNVNLLWKKKKKAKKAKKKKTLQIFYETAPVRLVALLAESCHPVWTPSFLPQDVTDADGGQDWQGSV